LNAAQLIACVCVCVYNISQVLAWQLNAAQLIACVCVCV
jgi:hypothetical protein